MTAREAGKVTFIIWPLQWETGEAEGSFVNGWLGEFPKHTLDVTA